MRFLISDEYIRAYACAREYAIQTNRGSAAAPKKRAKRKKERCRRERNRLRELAAGCFVFPAYTFYPIVSKRARYGISCNALELIRLEIENKINNFGRLDIF